MSLQPTEPIETLNRRLTERLGTFLDGSPKYRLVWSDDQYEKRFGEFEEFCGTIYLRTFVGVREVPKYPYAKSCWILEKCIPIPEAHKNELFTGSLYSWEPFYAFVDPQGNPLAPNWRMIEVLCAAIEGGPVKRTDGDFVQEENKDRAEDVKKFEEEIGASQRSELFAHESAVFLDSTKQKGTSNDSTVH
jgi:hypothetical protein